MRDGWWIAVGVTALWVLTMLGTYLYLVRLDRRANVSRSDGLGPGFGLSGGQVRRKAARGRTEAQRRYRA